MAISTSHLFVFLSIAAVAFAPSALATNYTVGDDAGWNVGVNYTLWANDKMFNVGDILIFNYPVGDHNVFKVNGSDFHDCSVPKDGQNALTTGNDAIVLAKPGKKWYICGKEGHCGKGQKLVITVMNMAPANSPLPGGSAPPPPSAATKAVVSAHFGFLALLVAVLGMMMP
ncbi:blue copper protein 1a-like [Benincasa hispida]|uniref:blue copper protein 1a-like n=1 Tax=Benincasa hispida TaxID=102211 RepID=UPI0019004063|nr:blue copper protein 1a-like [Benincasa hispida]